MIGFFYRSITCKYGVVHIEQDAETKGQEVEAELPGVRVDLGEDDGDTEDDCVKDQGEYYPRPRLKSWPKDNVDKVGQEVGAHRDKDHVRAPELVLKLINVSRI